METYNVTGEQAARLAEMNLDTVLELYAVLEWSTKGYVDLNCYNLAANQYSSQDMRRAIERALAGGVPLYPIPHHPADYATTIREMCANIANPDQRMDVFGRTDIDFDAPAVWGLGWGGVAPSSLDLPEGVRGVPANWLEILRERGFGQSNDARAGGDQTLFGLEERAMGGDFLAHCELRCLFVGVAKMMSRLHTEDLVFMARSHPVSSLAGHIRRWRHRDHPVFDRHGNRLPSASELMFARPGFLVEYQKRGERLIIEQGGLRLPPTTPNRPLTMLIGDVPVTYHNRFHVDQAVADVIGVDAAAEARRRAADRLWSVC